MTVSFFPYGIVKTYPQRAQRSYPFSLFNKLTPLSNAREFGSTEYPFPGYFFEEKPFCSGGILCVVSFGQAAHLRPPVRFLPLSRKSSRAIKSVVFITK